MKEENNNAPLGDFLTEGEILELFGIPKNALANLRNNEGLPYCKVNIRSRLYHEPSVREWLLARKKQAQRTTQNDSKGA